MKFRITLKDPDGFHESIADAAKESVAKLPLSDKEKEVLAGSRAEDAKIVCANKWFEYGEYLEVDVDTDAGTCVVVERK